MTFEENDLVRFKKDAYWCRFRDGIYANRTFIVDNMYESDTPAAMVYIKPLSSRDGDEGVNWISEDRPGGFRPDDLEKL